MPPTRGGVLPRRSRPAVSSAARRTRQDWDRTAESYERRSARALERHGAMAWGLWRLPEARVHLLGPYRGRDVLELGCGAARWSIALARRGARVTGLDVSPRRLEQAAELIREARVNVPLVEASAEDLPFPDAAFDLVFCDWGAMTFANPARTVPEVARVLRPGGYFSFAGAHVFRTVCEDRRRDRFDHRLVYDYFGLGRYSYPDSGAFEYQLPLGRWVRLFRANGLAIEEMVEPRPGRRARSPYLGVAGTAWGRHWPIEVLWKLRREAGSRPTPRARARSARP